MIPYFALTARMIVLNGSCLPVASRAAPVIHHLQLHQDAPPVQVAIAVRVINDAIPGSSSRLIGDDPRFVHSEGHVFRVGFGYDVHSLVEGRSLILGGVKIPHYLGLAGHSDADVLIHAMIDAILGALAKGDIGQHFPDSDPAYKDMDSTVMLEKVMTWVHEDGYRINQLDTTIVAEKPKLAPFVETMKQRLSDTLGIQMNQINIKATTTEGMGFCGRQDGIAAYAIVSLVAESTPS